MHRLIKGPLFNAVSTQIRRCSFRAMKSGLRTPSICAEMRTDFHVMCPVCLSYIKQTRSFIFGAVANASIASATLNRRSARMWMRLEMPSVRSSVGDLDQRVPLYRLFHFDMTDLYKFLTKFYIPVTFHLCTFPMNNQLDTQFLLYMFVYFYSLNVSSNPVLIIRRINCINTWLSLWWAQGCSKHIGNRSK